MQTGLRGLPGRGHGQIERLDEARYRVSESAPFQRAGKLTEVESDIAVIGCGVELQTAHVGRTLGDKPHGVVVKGGEEFYFAVRPVRGQGMSEAGRGGDVEFGRLRHHAAEKRDVQPVFGGIEVFLMDFFELRGESVLFYGRLHGEIARQRGFGYGAGLAFGKEEQRVVHKGFGESFGECFCLFRFGSGFHTGPGENFGHLLGTQSGFHAEFPKLKAYLPFPALGAYAGTGYPAHHGAFGRTHIVAVQAGDGKGLENMEFDAVTVEIVHVVSFLQVEDWG